MLRRQRVKPRWAEMYANHSPLLQQTFNNAAIAAVKVLVMTAVVEDGLTVRRM